MNITEDQKTALRLALRALDNSISIRTQDDSEIIAEEEKAYQIIKDILKKAKI